MVQMASDTSTPGRFPPGTSRYTLAMARCLAGIAGIPGALPNRTVVHALVNLVQGRMLEYLADRICREYDISEPRSRERIVAVLLGIFSDEFFALFRYRIEQQPGLVVKIARRILRMESGPPSLRPTSPIRQPSDRLYPAIFRKYFEYSNLDVLLKMVESDGAIQKILLENLLKKRLDDSPLYHEIVDLLAEDEEGVTPSLFMGYVKEETLDTLVEKVRSGTWKAERDLLHRRLALLRGE
jgi:hypothetical protein